jgi:hypothetical protein
MASILEQAKAGEFADSAVSARMGATLAFGTPEALDRLRAANLPAGPAVQREIAAARAAGLSEVAIRWLDGYERGSSSDALFSVTTGVQVGNPERARALPGSPDDLDRCLELARNVPEVRDNLERARTLGEKWARLLDHWQELASLPEAEYKSNSARLQEIVG